MNKVKARIVSLLLVIMCFCAMTPVASAAGYFNASDTCFNVKFTSVQRVTYVKDVYSNWKRMNSVFTARRAGETAAFLETKTVKTTSSLNLSVPIKSVSAKIGYTAEKLKSSTIRGTSSAPLKKNESAAFYYRDHWIRYKVVEKVMTRSFSRSAGFTETISYQTRYIDVAQKLNSYDYGWFYSKSPKALTKSLNAKYCDDKYSCKVA